MPGTARELPCGVGPADGVVEGGGRPVEEEPPDGWSVGRGVGLPERGGRGDPDTGAPGGVEPVGRAVRCGPAEGWLGDGTGVDPVRVGDGAGSTGLGGVAGAGRRSGGVPGRSPDSR